VKKVIKRIIGLRLMTDEELKIWNYDTKSNVMCIELIGGDIMAPIKDSTMEYLIYSKERDLLTAFN